MSSRMQTTEVILRWKYVWQAVGRTLYNCLHTNAKPNSTVKLLGANTDYEPTLIGNRDVKKSWLTHH